MTTHLAGLDFQDGFFVCTHHSGNRWCAEIREMIKRGEDGAFIAPKEDIWVPVFPGFGVWVQIELSAPAFGNACYMSMAYTPDFGQPYNIDLGLWNKGEGRWSMRSVIVDWLTSQLPLEDPEDTTPRIRTKCPSSTHGLAEERKMKANQDPGWRWACLWNIVMEKACLPCVESTAPDPTGNGLAGIGDPQPAPWSNP